MGTGAKYHRLNLDIGACLISIDLQEHVADAKSRAIAVGDDDLDLIHIGHHRGASARLARCSPTTPVIGHPDDVTGPGTAIPASAALTSERHWRTTRRAADLTWVVALLVAIPLSPSPGTTCCPGPGSSSGPWSS